MIKASSGLSEDEIKKMVEDAKAHAEEDRKFHELVSSRNHADSMIHAAEKSLKEMGDKISEDEKSSIHSAIEALKEAMKGNDKELIEKRIEGLTQASGKMAERMYAASGGAAGGPGAGPMGGMGSMGGDQAASGGSTGSASDQSQGAHEKGKEEVVDAEFEEIKEKDKK